MEFGRDAQGKIVLIDELLTRDSSRFWPAAEYKVGSNPPSFDKQFVRDWLDAQGWDHTPPAPGSAGRRRPHHGQVSQGRNPGSPASSGVEGGSPSCVIASAAKQSREPPGLWIASSLRFSRSRRRLRPVPATRTPSPEPSTRRRSRSARRVCCCAARPASASPTSRSA